MSESCGLRDFVPEVLNVAIPEVSNHGLVGRTSFAVDLSQTFHFVKDPRILVARQCWRRLRIKFIGARQSKGTDSRPLREICRCEIGRRELVVSGIVAGTNEGGVTPDPSLLRNAKI
jgi:hypothetical protein